MVWIEYCDKCGLEKDRRVNINNWNTENIFDSISDNKSKFSLCSKCEKELDKLINQFMKK